MRGRRQTESQLLERAARLFSVIAEPGTRFPPRAERVTSRVDDRGSARLRQSEQARARQRRRAVSPHHSLAFAVGALRIASPSARGTVRLLEAESLSGLSQFVVHSRSSSGRRAPEGRSHAHGVTSRHVQNLCATIGSCRRLPAYSSLRSVRSGGHVFAGKDIRHVLRGSRTRSDAVDKTNVEGARPDATLLPGERCSRSRDFAGRRLPRPRDRGAWCRRRRLRSPRRVA